jgi:hypothetical protein
MRTGLSIPGKSSHYDVLVLNMVPLDRNILEAALEGLEKQQARIEQRISIVKASLKRLTPSRPKNLKDTSTENDRPRARRPFTAGARERIGDAARKQWALARAGNKTATKTQQRTGKKGGKAVA